MILGRIKLALHLGVRAHHILPVFVGFGDSSVLCARRLYPLFEFIELTFGIVEGRIVAHRFQPLSHLTSHTVNLPRGRAVEFASLLTTATSSQAHQASWRSVRVCRDRGPLSEGPSVSDH